MLGLAFSPGAPGLRPARCRSPVSSTMVRGWQGRGQAQPGSSGHPRGRAAAVGCVPPTEARRVASKARRLRASPQTPEIHGTPTEDACPLPPRPSRGASVSCPGD